MITGGYNKVYTLQDLANGVCALKNDGTFEEIKLVLSKAFPNDKADLEEYIVGQEHNPVVHFQKDYRRELWCQYYSDMTSDLPMQSCSVFLKEIEGASEGVTEGVNSNCFQGGMNLDTPTETFEPSYSGNMRQFETGATRNLDADKLDFEGFLSPLALEEFAKYMHKNRVQADGNLRDSDNWQKGIPIDAYMSSMWRHFFDTWKRHRGLETHEDQISNLCGLMFNVQGMLHELLKQK